MRKYADVYADVVPATLVRPTKGDFTNFFGYNQGTLILDGDGKNFPTKEAAVAAGATVTERNFNEDAYKAAMAVYNGYMNKVSEAFHAELRAEYPDLNDATFDLAYNAAYERGHSYGMDEVALILNETADFALKVIAANRDA